ncbi:MAG: hypothetical protein KGZ41_02505 [Dethiobacter sp.]|jgi:predicted  nucleic acid-binding Zn-ribbon protein|nr:hypothetical protein [Dethiobacter sp.]MBS3982650.1 hypothetical protein [Dethiobacter sp.]MCL4463307.1 hypothetical protein [Bacillota bacterium]MCL5994067.1 hypothetical protein [Bacillota bacterium]
MGELHILFELQQIDLKLEKLQETLKKLPVFEEFKNLKEQASTAKEVLARAEGKLQVKLTAIRSLEGLLQEAVEEHKEVQARLYGDAEQSAKELEKLEQRAAALKIQQQKQEEELLMAMEGAEELTKAVAVAKSKFNDAHQKLREKQKSGNEEISRLKEEILHYKEQRQLLSMQVAKPLLEEYDAQRQKFLGRPLAEVDKDICQGCRVSVSSMVKAKLYHPDCKINCDNCGRILLPHDQ